MSEAQDMALMAEALAHQTSPALLDDSDRPPDDPRYRPKKRGWMPDLNPTQLEIFNDASPIVCAYGPKGTGKTWAVSQRVIRHCYDYKNALVEIIALRAAVLGEGMCHDMEIDILPEWERGIGLEHTPWKLDNISKDRHMWVKSRHGTWSKIVAISIPHAAFIKERIKGPAPSMVVLEEASDMASRDYYTFPALQLKRRTRFSGPQQMLMACNPKGHDNWVFKFLWEEEVDDVGGVPDMKDREKPGIKRSPGTHVYFVGLEENKKRLSADYLTHITHILQHDPVERQRLIEGLWVDAPAGEALFKEWFNRGRHVRGDAEKQMGLLPLLHHPIIVGYDPGPVNMCITIKQCIETAAGPMWLIYDCIFAYRKRMDYRAVVSMLLNKLAYWNRRMEFQFKSIHISDDQALTQSNTHGSTYARDFYDYSKELIMANPERYAGLEPIRMKACPKPPDSIRDRMRLTVDLLAADPPMLLVSATCKPIISAFEQLLHEDGDLLMPKDPSKWKHAIDAPSYCFYHRRYLQPRGYEEPGNESSVTVTKL